MTKHLSLRDTVNIGDRYTAPGLYLKLPGVPSPGGRAQIGELSRPDVGPAEDLIVGGGGFIRHHQLHPYLTAGRLVVWGAGDNVHDDREDPGHPPLPKAALVGTRDWPAELVKPGPERVRWVPCASCLHPAFDEARKIVPQYRAVAYEHFEHPLPASVEGLPLTTNARWRFLKDAINFLASGEIVVTNSYHGMYWATLLGRRVIVYPLSTRHRRFKYRVPLLERGTPWNEAMTDVYPDALAECRTVQRSFSREVWAFLEPETPVPDNGADDAPGVNPDTVDEGVHGMPRHRVSSLPEKK